MTGAASEVPALWDMDSAADYYECDCPGPPPEFHLPPPPRPPPELLAELAGSPVAQGWDCNENFETCDMTVIQTEPSNLPALSSLAIVGLFSLLLLTFIIVAAALLCKHKKKMQNLLPCKSSPQNRCDVTHGNGVIYEDLTNIRPRPLPQPSIEMLNVKNYPHSGHNVPHHPSDHHYVTNHFPSMMGGHQPVFICSRPPPTPLYCPQGQDLYNPVYEELSNGSAERGDSDSEDGERLRGVSSEEDFAEDELSGAEHAPPTGSSQLHAPSSNSLLSSGHHAPSNNSLLASSSGHATAGNFLAPSSGNDVNSDGEEDRVRFLNNRAKHSSLPKSRRQSHQGQRQLGARTSGRSHRSTNTSSSHGSNAVGPTSLDRRRPAPSSGDRSWRAAKPEAYHEGLLVDALLQLYPNMVPPPPASQHRPYVVPCAPYQSVPVISSYGRNEPPVSSFRPMLPHFPPPPTMTAQPSKVPSQDSDSGYSNNTSGGTQSTSARGTSRSRTNHRMNADNLYS